MQWKYVFERELDIEDLWLSRLCYILKKVEYLCLARVGQYKYYKDSILIITC